MSTHPPSASNFEKNPDVTPSFDPIYTSFLIHKDELFATECAQTRLFGSKALCGVSEMAHILDAASEQPLSVYNGRKEYLDVDTHSWRECLQIIDDHEWTVSNPDPGESLSVHGA
jgi:hypothetical protein